jgi:quinoprotein glucose dehydrogenase
MTVESTLHSPFRSVSLMPSQSSIYSIFTGSILVAATVGLAVAADPKEPNRESNYNPTVHKDNGDGEKAISRFNTTNPSRSISGPLSRCWRIRSPSASTKKAVHVAETFRHSAGVTDNRSHMNWLDDELACRTVEERVAMYKKYAKDRFEQTYEKATRPSSTHRGYNRCGQSDKVTVFRDDFGKAADGIGSGSAGLQRQYLLHLHPRSLDAEGHKGTGQPT